MNRKTTTRNSKLLLFSCAVLLSAAFFCTGCSSQSRSFDQMRLAFRETLVGPPGLDLNDSAVIHRIDRVDGLTKEYWTSMNKTPDRTWLWEDCNVEGISTITLVPYSRLYYMALAVSTPGSEFYGNDSLKRDVIDGMDWMEANRYSPSIPLYDNWWMFVIGTPLNITRVMTLLYDDLTPEQRARYEAAMNHYAPDVTYEGAATGANKVWQCAAMAARGFLTQDPAKLDMAVKGLETEFKTVTTSDGFYEDGSFVQHQWHPYTGGYGRSLLENLVNMIEIVHGSQWEIPQAQMEMLYGWVRNAYEPLLYRGAFMDMVRGREMSRPGAGDRGTGHSIMQQLFRLSQLSTPTEKAYLQSLVKGHALADSQRDMIDDIPFYLIGEYRKMMADTTVHPLPTPTRHKLFAAMDRAVHTTPQFAVGLAMSSARIENYETINGENLKGWYIGDGMTYLYDNDLRQYSESFWATVNPYRMAGTTVDTRPRKAETLPLAPGLLYADGYKSPQHWVGGSSILDLYASEGMWLNGYESSLEAKKSWFMCGDQIVALGAGISSRDNRTIETIAENRKMNPGAAYRITLGKAGTAVSGQTGKAGTVPAEELAPRTEKRNRPTPWAHFEGMDEATSVGYCFPGEANLCAQREERTGTWMQINTMVKDSTPITREYFSLWFDHGRNPSDAAYAYILLPNRSAAQTAAYSAAPDAEILANTPQVQAVHFKNAAVTGLNFWQPSANPVAGVSVDAPASVTMREDEEGLTIGVSDPTQLNTGKIRITLDRAVGKPVEENPKIRVLSTSPLSFEADVKDALGATREIRFASIQ